MSTFTFDASALATCPALSASTSLDHQPGATSNAPLAAIRSALDEVWRADRAYEDAVVRLFADTEPLGLRSRLFGRLLDRYVALVQHFRTRHSDGHSVSWAAAEKLLQEAEGGMCSFRDLYRFAVTYSDLRGVLHTVLEDMNPSWGRDALGNLCDNLPLLGRNLAVRIATRGCHGEGALGAKVRRAVGKDLGSYILLGKNNNEGSLFNVLATALPDHLDALEQEEAATRLA